MSLSFKGKSKRKSKKVYNRRNKKTSKRRNKYSRKKGLQ